MPADRRAATAVAIALAVAGGVLGAAPGGPARAQGDAGTADAPQTAIPWLGDSLDRPTRADERPAAPPAANPVTVTTLGATRADAAGLLPGSVTGLPADTIAGSDPTRLAALYRRQPADALPAMHGLVRMLLLAELDPPRAASADDSLFAARIDALMRLGAVEQAQALLERAGPRDRALFARWFDAALLTGDDEAMCAALRAAPALAPGLDGRVFCLARGGDFPAAWLTLDGARALDVLDAQADRRLAQFLDPELYEGAPPPPAPRPMTPLAFRLLDGIGETPATRDLPAAYAVADLRRTSGWKAQIDAAERLARTGALDANRLLALYTARRPSASGGAWERAAAVQALDDALTRADAAAVAAALPHAVARMAEAGLLVPLATLYGARLAELELQGMACHLAKRLALLSPDPAAAVARIDPDAAADLPPRLAFATALARGAAPDPPPGDALARTVADGLAAAPPADLMRLVAEDRLGEALLTVAARLGDGAASDPQDAVEGLAFLRGVGMTDVAMRTAMQMLLAETAP